MTGQTPVPRRGPARAISRHLRAQAAARRLRCARCRRDSMHGLPSAPTRTLRNVVNSAAELAEELGRVCHGTVALSERATGPGRHERDGDDAVSIDSLSGSVAVPRSVSESRPRLSEPDVSKERARGAPLAGPAFSCAFVPGVGSFRAFSHCFGRMALRSWHCADAATHQRLARDSAFVEREPHCPNLCPRSGCRSWSRAAGLASRNCKNLRRGRPALVPVR